MKIVTVPRNLYYHEIAYVRGIEADNERLRAALQACVRGSGDWMEKAKAALEPKP